MSRPVRPPVLRSSAEVLVIQKYHNQWSNWWMPYSTVSGVHRVTSIPVTGTVRHREVDDEPTCSPGGAGSCGAVASATGGGHRPAFQRREPVLLAGGQGPGQIRDAARPRRGRTARDRRRGPPRLCQAELLSGPGGLRRGGDDRIARRPSRAAGAGEADRGDRRPPVGGAGGVLGCDLGRGGQGAF